MSRLLSSLLTLARPLRILRRCALDPVRVQREVLVTLLRQASNTEWGRRYGFAELAGHPHPMEAYRSRVPLHGHQDYGADIQRTFLGERDIFWPGRIDRFATSAGTTAPGKLLPISEARLGANRDYGTAMLLEYLRLTGNFRCLGGNSLALSAGLYQDPRRPEVKLGGISGLQAEYRLRDHRLPRRARERGLIPAAIRNIGDWDQRFDALADYSMRRDIRIFGMMPSFGLELIERIFQRYLEAHGRPAENLREIWPKLQLVLSGGVPLSAYRTILQERLGEAKVDFLETYGASEGYLAFQTELDDPALLLHLGCGIYYEFVPLDELAKANPARLHIGEVVTGVRYALYLSTNSGLWAYPIGDIVRFTRLRPHKILIAGRTTETIDSYGEDLSAEEFRQALNAVCEATGTQVIHCHLAPRHASARQRHALQVFLELAKSPTSGEDLARRLDHKLCELNPNYYTSRHERGMGEVEVVRVPAGLFHRWLGLHRDRFDVQTKVPLMSEDRFIADGLLQLLLGTQGLDRVE